MATSLSILSPRLRPAATATLWWLGAVAASLPVLFAIWHWPEHAAAVGAAMVALAAASVLVLHRPAWGACALALIVYWNASDVVTETFGFSWLLRLAMAGVIAAAVANALVSDRPARGRWPLLVPLVVYGAAQAVATLGAVNRAAAVGALSEYGKALVVFYLIVELLPSPRAWRRALDAVLVAVVLMSAPLVYQGLTGSRNQFFGFGAMVYKEIAPGQMGWRLGGTLGEPNFLAMVLVATLPLALMEALSQGRGTGGRARQLLGWVAAGSLLLATVYTYSRAAFLGVGLVLVVMALKHRRRQWIVACTLVGLGLAAALAPQGLMGRLATLTQLTEVKKVELPDASFQIRRNAVYAGVLMLRDHPLFGVGPDNYPYNYLQYSAEVGLASDPTLRDAHNLYVQVAAETGLLGLISFALVLFTAFGLMERGRRRLRQLGADAFADLIWAVELCLITYLTLSLFLHAAYFRHFMLLLALGAAGATVALEGAPRALGARAPAGPKAMNDCAATPGGSRA